MMRKVMKITTIMRRVLINQMILQRKLSNHLDKKKSYKKIRIQEKKSRHKPLKKKRNSFQNNHRNMNSYWKTCVIIVSESNVLKYVTECVIECIIRLAIKNI